MSPSINRGMVLAALLTIGASYPAIASPAPTSSNARVDIPPVLSLKRGDLVRLRSGGPMMTVSVVKGDQVECLWTDVNGQTDDATFPADVLRKS